MKLVGASLLLGSALISCVAAFGNAHAQGREGEPQASPGTAQTPGPSRALLDAENAHRSGRCDDAIRLYSQALEAMPDMLPALRGRANCRLRQGSDNAAVADYGRVVAQWPGDAATLGGLGWALIRLGRFAEARPYLERQRQLAPTSYAAAVNVGHTYLLTNDPGRARSYYAEALALIETDEQFRDGPVADFDLFVRNGWSPDLALQSRDWMTSEYPRYADRRAALIGFAKTLFAASKGDAAGDAQALQAGLRGIEAAYGADDLHVATALNEIATLNARSGMAESRLPWVRRSLSIRERTLGPDHPLVAESVAVIGGLLVLDGRYRDALPYVERRLAIMQRTLGATHPDTAASLAQLGSLHVNMGEYHDALPLLENSLAVREALYGPDHPSVADGLTAIARVRFAMHDAAGMIPPARRVLAIRESVLGPEHEQVASALNNLAEAYEMAGDYAAALPLFRRSLAIGDKLDGPDSEKTAATRANLALLEMRLGHSAEALAMMKRAVENFERAWGPEHPDLAVMLGNLAVIHSSVGHYADALPLLERSLAISEKSLGGSHPSVATTLNNLGELYVKVGRYGEAQALLRRSVAIREQLVGPDNPLLAPALNNLGIAYQAEGRYEEAQHQFERGLALLERAYGSEHADVATALDNLAQSYLAMNQPVDAIVTFKRCLAIRRQVLGDDHPAVAITTSNLATVYATMGQIEEALELWRRVLPIAERGDQPELRFTVYSLLAQAYATRGQNDLAIAWGKEAVNGIQALRATLGTLDPGLQRSFLSAKRRVYAQLADWLIGAGRIDEAQEVLQMLKEQELYDNLQRGNGKDLRATQIDLTGLELSKFADYHRLRERQAALNSERRALEHKQRIATLTEAEVGRLRDIRSRDLPVIEEAMQALLASLQKELGSVAPPGQVAPKVLATMPLLRQSVAQLATTESRARAVGLQYVVSDERLSIVVSVAGAPPLARQVAIDRGKFNRLVTDFSSELKSSATDPSILKATAHQLYDLLIAPVSGDLRAARAHTLMLSLNDVLRYVPFAALYDGEKFLVEDFAIALYNEAAAQTLVAAPPSRWRVAGLGLSEAVDGLPALKQVPEELRGIVHAIGGSEFLDAKFDRPRLLDTLGADFNVLHMASHFVFQRGDAANSRLYLGDKSRLTLAEMTALDLRFDHFDLVTLSACETGKEGGKDAYGQELESLGAKAQIQGAQAVMATLWKVYDRSTAAIMSEFYRRKSEDHVNKAEALRSAQLALLRGEIRLSRQQDYAMPYFWAPFVLMGNWR